MAGVSRSTSILVAFLLDVFFEAVRSEKMREYLQEAHPGLLFSTNEESCADPSTAKQMVTFCVKFVGEARCFVCPNEGFTKQLNEYTLQKLRLNSF
ncbi:hypothetical protein AGDE_09125 [Angomonas deanei]|nr:hypothetical protein AGDE_09125 [Angomonas deanei]|eukprot:EPY31291.1 hypothetical protein AGDE_09125 [Angomonas deanei]